MRTRVFVALTVLLAAVIVLGATRPGHEVLRAADGPTSSSAAAPDAKATADGPTPTVLAAPPTTAGADGSETSAIDEDRSAEGVISTEGDIGPEDRAFFGEVAGAHRGEHPSEPVVVHWAAMTEGEPVADTEEMARVAAAAYADPRGWNIAGAQRFERVTDPAEADFLLVMAEADLIPGYSESCLSWQTGEADASCTVGNYVIINDHRWRDGALGNRIPLELFRIHEINHETGHWLGQGHFSCLGGVAAVNQQQFRALDGCAANAWPLPWEQAMVAVRRGLWPGAGSYEPYDTVGGGSAEEAGGPEPGTDPGTSTEPGTDPGTSTEPGSAPVTETTPETVPESSAETVPEAAPTSSTEPNPAG